MKSPNLRHSQPVPRAKDCTIPEKSWMAADLPNPAGDSGEAGPSQSQKGAYSASEMASATKLQTGFQFLTKAFLRFWMVDICREGRSQRSASQKRYEAHRTGAPGNRCWDGEGRSRTTPGESALVKLLVPRAAQTGEGTKRRPNRVCAFVSN